MKLGSIELPTDLLLAPLMDVTTPSFRQLICDLGGVGLVVTPMVFVQQIALAPKTVLPHLEHIENQSPASVQIVASGRNEEHIKKAIDFLSSFQFDILDINGGCPATHTMKSGGGGALLRDYLREGSISRFQKIIEAAIKYSSRPVSVKTRLGYEKEEEILEICKMIEKSGAEFLTIHGRTVKQKYQSEINFEFIKQVKNTVEIPVVGNGDVVDYESYKNMKDRTGCDAVMIGRAVMADPLVFNKIWQQQKSSKNDFNLPPFTERHSIEKIRQYLLKNHQFIESSSQFWNTERFKLAEMRRLAIWFIKGIRGYKKVRERLSKFNDIHELKSYIFSKSFEEDFVL
ncbi:tRNA dihydrouridine synthase [Promethearchaeum syntrophicum]|uniref:tRNA dihydrouridine synthase n=1 Tax=Promethearchaeum syntrophicum TaxID=2594042 RepID=A0A5B9DDZ7_9ARCH|nr:tRNA-dihydrouridine synthase family protein [Candidatus Prometheoarchaeum syntrophicum]QEE17312.1 tRNA-dihydrouridine synthase B [Candidatus Prometheoarchaeum syntrophicum]